MNKPTLNLSRRAMLQSTGALCVAFSLTNPARLLAQTTTGEKPPLLPTELDSWLAIDPQGMVTIYFGKIDGGQGTDIAIAQMVAEELDIAVTRCSVVMGDTALTCNQGGASGSNGVRLGGIALRNAAAEARLILVERAAAEWGVAADGLTVEDGMISNPANPAQSISYADLVGGNYFHEDIEWNGTYGNNLRLSGRATPKTPDQYRVVGRPARRLDVEGKVYGTEPWITDIRVPGMLHGRMIRPENAGSVPVSFDASSVAHIPNVQVVHRENLIGVVAPREWDAVRAARELNVTWSEARDVFPDQTELYNHIRNAPVSHREVATDEGDIAAAFSGAAQIVEAEYEWPYQSHASMGGGCALVDVRADGVRLWTGTQKPHYASEGVAAILGVPIESVHGTWIIGPGSYGRNDAGDATMDAAVLSREVGAPVRVQYMRHEGTGWDPKGPASVHTVRAALDADGKIVGWDFYSKAFSRADTDTNESQPKDTLAGQLLGFTGERVVNFGAPENAYEFPNNSAVWETIPTLLEGASPLRTSHLRDPVGPQIQFVSESFMDEIAAAAGADPVEFRLRHLTNQRDRDVITAAAERSGWRAGPAGTRRGQNGELMTGQGIAYSRRAGTLVAIVTDVEVNQRTGRVWIRKATVAHDCGQIINPATLKTVIEGNIVQGISRSLFEEVNFSRRAVTSVDWISYPIIGMRDVPEEVDVILIDRPEEPPLGAGEPSMRMLAASINNAVFEATGVRFRRAPLTPARVRASFS
jgi:nicotinate dehydrogenase subunit B